MPAERIGPDDLLRLGRQTIKPGAQIDRLTGEINIRSWRQADHRLLVERKITRSTEREQVSMR